MTNFIPIPIDRYIIVLLDTPGYGSVVDAQLNFDMFMSYVGQTFEEKNKRISPFTEVSNNELMRSLVTGTLLVSHFSLFMFVFLVFIFHFFLLLHSRQIARIFLRMDHSCRAMQDKQKQQKTHAALFFPTFDRLGVGAHKFIDVVFYLVVHRLKPIDVEYMRLISEKANVVPVICKVDTQSEQEVRDLKVQVLKTLKEQGVSIYTFRIDYDRLIHMAENGQVGGPPFAVCNTAAKPVSEDANDHIAFTPASNELPLLRKLVLETQITNIRQFTVKKFINWRGKHLAQQQQQQHQQHQQQQPLQQQQAYYQQHQYQQTAR